MRRIHTKPNTGATNEWLTPPEILDQLGDFDLDPCTPVNRPWDTALVHYTREDDGLRLPWSGRVFLNPPYGPLASMWVAMMADHGNGIALLAARVETRWFHRYVWQRADAVLFLNGRLYFCTPDGKPARGNAGHGSVLVAYGAENAAMLEACGIAGKFISLNCAVTV